MITRALLRIYDYLHTHRYLRFLLLVTLLTAAVISVLQLRFKEDISDFLPDNDTYHRSMDVYRQINAADRIFVVFQMSDTTQTDIDRIVEAVNILKRRHNKNTGR